MQSIGHAAIAGVVDRPRLYQILESPLIRICVVQGPSGSGKTTLVRSWALQGERPRDVTWISLGPGINSRLAFWKHVADSAGRLGELSQEAVVQIREQLSVAMDPVRIASEILADAGPVVLVLDAYEHLGEAMAEIDADLARLVAAVPKLRIMITTRRDTALAEVDPPGGVVRVITLGELALTPEEIESLIASQTGITDARLARSVAAATRGFALTVRAVVLALSQLGRIPHVDSMEWDAIVAARLESLLPDPALVQFVTDTSVPPYVDEELGRMLSDRSDTAELFQVLERNGFGRWVPYARNRPVFQYVETIRDSFLARAAEDQERFRRSCTISAGWLFENHEIDQALMVAIEGGDYAFADRLFVPLVIYYPDTYVTDRFLTTFRSIPEDELANHPMLAFGLGLALLANPILRLEAPRALWIAIDSTAHPAYIEPAFDAFALDSMRAVCRRLAGQYREGAIKSLEAARSVDALPPELLAKVGEEVGTVLRQLSYSLLLGGMIDDAIATMSRSVALCTSQAARNYSIVYAAGASAFAGDVVRAKALLASMDRETWPEEMRHTSMNGLGLVADGYARLDEIDFAGAVEVIRTADWYMQTVEYWPFLTAVAVCARHGLGQAQAEVQRVLRLLAGPTPPGVGENSATENLYAVLARSWIAAGDLRAAGALLDERPPDSPYAASVRVSRLLGEERAREALALAEELLELPAHTLRTRAETQTWGAVAALRQNRPELAWAWLTSAAVTWETHGTRMHVAMLAPRERRLLWEFARDRESAALERYLDVPVIGGRSSGLAASLTPRERVVLAALAEHDSIRAIAEALVVSPHTVKAQLQGVYRKLGVSSRQAAVAVAYELGLIDDGLVPVLNPPTGG